MRPFFATIAIVSCLSAPLSAQETANTILVLDGSGSMWGQIDGVAKITIAQEVIADLLPDLPDTQNLGLTVYGHRVKGDCTDIETVVPAGQGTRDAIMNAVNGIKPKGKTPLSDAVIMAAEALKYTEEAATVILVSDGRETCEADPCAVGRKLEEAGINFTAHVVGFDVSGDETALRELQCLADETGGQFVTASDAAGLSTALAQVAEEPEPVFYALTARAETELGDAIQSGLRWTVSGSSIDDQSSEDATIRSELEPGTYTVSVMRLSDEATATAEARITDAPQSIVLTLPFDLPPAAVMAPGTAFQGQVIEVTWDGPGNKKDLISVADTEDGPWPINRAQVSRKTTVALTMPAEPGDYFIRYELHEGAREILAAQAISVLPSEVTMTAPQSAEIGADIQVDWTGPDNKGDVISVHEAGGNIWSINRTQTSKGSPLTLRMPSEPGDYELRYQLAEEQHVIYRQPITITEAAITMNAPAEAEIGAEISIEGTGPDNKGDVISVHEVGGDVWSINRTQTSKGSPLKLRMPSEPGAYELRYQLAEEQEIIFRQPITVSEASVSLTAPAQAEQGQTISIEWSGPDNKGDVISVHEAGGDVWSINRTQTAKGNPLELRMPQDPGAYELRYQLAEEQEIIYRQPITITAAAVTLSPPASAEQGETISIDWTGPDNKGDVISVHEAGGDVWSINRTQTAKGNPLQLRMPHQPGAYEIRYQLAEEQAVIHRVPIEVTAADIMLKAPASAAAGSEIELIWTGPDNQGDFISTHEVGGDVWAMTKTRTSKGSPLRLKMPDSPGDYEIRYQLAEEQAVIYRMPITVTE